MTDCVPKCKTCTGLCETLKARAVARKRTIDKVRNNTPNSKGFVRMPCGCLALPVEIYKYLGGDIKGFICDIHGEVKVSKKWLKDATIVGRLVRHESEFGYQVTIDNTDN
jgi:hypothetical protein